MSGADLAIRLRRAAFNRALADADLAAIGPILAPTCVLVTGTDSAVLSGRKAQLAAWQREFGASPRCVYVRMPDDVTLSAVAPVALETGHWTGTVQGAASPEAAGRYSAKWRKVAGDWVIEAEVYVTLA